MPANRQWAMKTGTSFRCKRIYGECWRGRQDDGSTMIESLSLDISFPEQVTIGRSPWGEETPPMKLWRNNFRLLTRSIWMNKRGTGERKENGGQKIDGEM